MSAPRKTQFIGPLFSWELVRLARRGQDARARTILAASLFLTLAVFTVIWFPSAGLHDLITGTQKAVKLEDSARFAEQFSLALLLVQLAVMCLITPAYAAGSLAEEKERKTFGHLLASDLTGREIVLGKYLARVVFLLGVLLAGLPVLAITGLTGGIDPLFLVTAYALTAGTVAVVSAMSVTAAVYAGTFRGALFRAYGVTALYVLVGGVHPMASPFAVLTLAFFEQTWSPQWYVIIFGGYIGLQLLVSLFCIWLAVRSVRGKRLTKPPRDPRGRRRSESVAVEEAETLTADDVPELGVPLAKRVKVKPLARPTEDDEEKRRRRRRPVYDLPGVAERPRVFADDPFYWKERYTLGVRRTSDEESIRGVTAIAGVAVAGVVGMAAIISLAAAVANPARTAHVAAGWLVVAGAGAVFGQLLLCGSAAVQTVLRERHRQTLEPLLTVPADRGEILWPKWRVAFSRGWWWGGPGMLAFAGGLLLSDVPSAAIPAAVYLPAAVVFACSLGLWLSVRGRTIARAMMIYLSVAGALLALPMGVWWFLDRDTQLWAFGLLAVAAVGVSAGGWLFWRSACREFERYGRD